MFETSQGSEEEHVLKEVTNLRDNLSNRHVEGEYDNSRSECRRKQNLDTVNQNCQGMKKKLKPSNIEFK